MASFSPIFNEDEGTVLRRMFDDIDEGFAQVNASETLDKREGSAVWLMTFGVAKELARVYDAMNDVAELAFVQFLQDDFLTDKALEYGLTRLPARSAGGFVAFYGTAGSNIPAGVTVSNTTQFIDDQVFTYETLDTATVSTESAPLTAPVISGGGFGDLTGFYSYRFTFVEVDAEGQPVSETPAGPASGNFSASSNSIIVGGFPTPPSEHRLRIYRTASTGTTSGVWKLVVEIADPAVAFFTDRFKDTQIGSYFVWDGLDSTGYDGGRSAGPITAHDIPAAYTEVQAVEDGELYNLAAGEINFLSDGVPGVSEVINHRDFVTGSDLEADEDFRPRVLARIQQPQGAGTIQDYVDWCLEVPGVAFVTVHPHFDGVIDRPGYVHVVVRDSNNDPISSDLLTIIREGGVVSGQAITGLDPSPTGSGKGRAPIGAKVVLQTVRKDLIRVSATVRAEAGYSLSPTTGQINLRVLVDNSLSALLDNVDPGSVVYESAVLDAIYNTEGVQDVVVDSGFALSIIDSETELASPLAQADTSGNWTLGKNQVLGYDSSGSSLTEV